MPTHGHGQGHADINFVIPTLMQPIGYFYTVGVVNMRYRRNLDGPYRVVRISIEHVTA